MTLRRRKRNSKILMALVAILLLAAVALSVAALTNTITFPVITTYDGGLFGTVAQGTQPSGFGTAFVTPTPTISG